MKFLETVTKPLLSSFKYVVDSKPGQAFAKSKAMEMLSKIWRNKYFASAYGLGLAGAGISAIPLLGAAGIPLAALGVIRGGASIFRGNTPLVAQRVADELAAKNNKLKHIGLPALGVGGLGVGYKLGKDSDDK